MLVMFCAQAEGLFIRFLNKSETKKIKVKNHLYRLCQVLGMHYLTLSHFSDEEARGQRGQVTSPRSYTYRVG